MKTLWPALVVGLLLVAMPRRHDEDRVVKLGVRARAAQAARGPWRESREGRTSLHSALLNKRYDDVRRMLAEGADPNRKRSSGESILLDAVRETNDEMVELLLVYGADPNLHRKYARGPLHDACRWGTSAMVEMLIAAGAEVDARDGANHRPTALWFAVSKRNARNVELLLQAGADPNLAQPLCRAISDGSTSIALALLDAGADPNTGEEFASRSAFVPLLLAVERNNLTLVRRLLAAGARPHLQHAYSETALLSAAVMTDNLEIVEALLAAGARLNASYPNPSGTPLGTAAARGNPAMVALLLRCGADATVVFDEGDTLYSFAANDEVRGLLVRHGAVPPTP